MKKKRETLMERLERYRIETELYEKPQKRKPFNYERYRKSNNRSKYVYIVEDDSYYDKRYPKEHYYGRRLFDRALLKKNIKSVTYDEFKDKFKSYWLNEFGTTNFNPTQASNNANNAFACLMDKHHCAMTHYRAKEYCLIITGEDLIGPTFW